MTLRSKGLKEYISKLLVSHTFQEGFRFLCSYNIKNIYIKNLIMANANKMVNIS